MKTVKKKPKPQTSIHIPGDVYVSDITYFHDVLSLIALMSKVEFMTGAWNSAMHLLSIYFQYHLVS